MKKRMASNKLCYYERQDEITHFHNNELSFEYLLDHFTLS